MSRRWCIGVMIEICLDIYVQMHSGTTCRHCIGDLMAIRHSTAVNLATLINLTLVTGGDPQWISYMTHERRDAGIGNKKEQKMNNSH
ncbi:hypothetical protein ACTXT7_015583 [Hymenolepis weldensis]